MTFSPSEAELCGPHLTSGRFNNSSFFFGFVSTHFISPHHEALRLQLSSSSSSSWFFFFFSPHKSVSHLNALFKKTVDTSITSFHADYRGFIGGNIFDLE